MVKKISTEEYKKMDKAGIALIDFSATWCGPCQRLAPVLEEVSREYEGKLSFYNVDADESPELTREFEAQYLPTLAIVKDGKKVDVQIGFQPKENLKEFIDRNI